MKLIVCLDDKGGLLFNRRRQSRDRRLVADVLEMARGKRLYCAPFSATLFEGQTEAVVFDESFLSLAEDEDFCFAEEGPFLPWLGRIHMLILYRWNRTYPADVYFDLNPEAQGFTLRERTDFPGHSHETITKEVYLR